MVGSGTGVGTFWQAAMQQSWCNVASVLPLLPLLLISRLVVLRAECWPESERVNVTYANRPDRKVVLPPIQLVRGGE